MANVVTAPLVLAKDETGAQHYFYKDAVLPDYVKGEQLQRLVDDKLVAAVEDDKEQPPPEMAAGSDPASFTVDQVLAFFATADDAEKARIVEAEKAGKNRSSLLAKLEAPAS